jgi:uncharacterized OB-fold protein
VSRALPIAAVSLVWPAGRLDGNPIDGPDEDAFTLAVEAIERLPSPAPRRAIARLRPFGGLPPRLVGDLAEAVGCPAAHVDGRRPLAEVWEALADRPSRGREDSEIMVLVCPSPAFPEPSQEANSAALAILRASDGTRRVMGPAPGPDDTDPSAVPPSALHQLEIDPGETPLFRRDLLGAPGEPAGSAMWALSFWSALTDRSGKPLVLLAGPSGAEALFGLTGAAPAAFGEIPPRPDGFPWKDRTAWLARPSEQPPTLSEGAYVPRPTYVAQRPSRWRLAAVRCSNCGRITFPVRSHCRHCGRTETLEPIELPHRDLRVEAMTVVHQGAQPTEFDRQAAATGSYAVVVAEAASDARITLQLADAVPSSVRIGDRVDLVLRRLIPMEGEWRYGLKAIPSPSAARRTGGGP